jgi:hypothetical protein
LSAASVSGINTLRFRPRYATEPGWIDSPSMSLVVTDASFLVFRMRHLLNAAVGKVVFRNETFSYQAARETGDWSGESWAVDFPVNTDGQWHVYSIPFFPDRYAVPTRPTIVSRMRMYPAYDVKGVGSAEIDWVRVMHAPTIMRVEGCSNMTGVVSTPNHLPPYMKRVRRGYQSLTQNFATPPEALARVNATADTTLPLASTYNCVPLGGDRITIRGEHFGLLPPKVLINGIKCENVVLDVPQVQASCTLPPGSGVNVAVTLANGRLPILTDTKPFLSYTTPAGPPRPPIITNVNAYSLDVNWLPPPEVLEAMATSGYRLQWRSTASSGARAQVVGAPPVTTYDAKHDIWWGDWDDVATFGGMTHTGNVTTTTIRGLRPYTRYQFRVAAMSENTVSSLAWTQTDIYGQREPVIGFVLGTYSEPSEPIRTLAYDVIFTRFDANATLDYGPAFPNSSMNVLGWSGGEGAYGLVIVGSAHVGNCNASSVCCDGFGGPSFVDRLKALDGDSLNPFKDIFAWDTGTFDWTNGEDRAYTTFDLPGQVTDYAESHPAWSLYTRGHGLPPFATFFGLRKQAYLWDGYDDSGAVGVMPSETYNKRMRELEDKYEAELAKITDPFLPTPAPPRKAIFDAKGRRMMPMDVPPGSFCRAVCFSSGGLDAPYLSHVAQRGTDVYPDGVLPGRQTAGTFEAYYDVEWNQGDRANKMTNLPTADTLAAWQLTEQALGVADTSPYADTGNTTQTSTTGSGNGTATNSTTAYRRPLTREELEDRYFASLGLLDPSYGIDAYQTVSGRFLRRNAVKIQSSTGDHMEGPSMPYPNTTFPNGITIVNPGPSAPNVTATAPCGPALRLTSSLPNQVGAAWYSRPQQVREGFDTTFVFRIANPSSFCNKLDDVFTHCRSRGGAGFAFVVQNWHPASLGGTEKPGQTGHGLGYDGIRNSIAIEFDTYHDPEMHDPWENHISVHTRGYAAGNTANHTHSLGHTKGGGFPDMTDGIHVVRILYSPTFDPQVIAHPAFSADSPVVADFATNKDFASGGRPEWYTGFGMISVFFDDGDTPVLIVPMNLATVMDLTQSKGRAWVGFTASTGGDVWQTHDILAWHFTQLRLDADNVDAPVYG